MSLVCPKCDSPIILNGPSDFGHCNACQIDIPLPADFWKETFESILQSIITDLKDGEGQTSTSFGMLAKKMIYCRLKPKCSECNTYFNLETINPNKETIITCAKCKHETSLIPAPIWLKEIYPVVDYFVNAQVLSKEKIRESVIAEGIAITCPRCGASLIIDGKDRLVKCDYCKLHVFLPDNLWLRLHPAFIKSEWFIIFNEKKVQEINFDEEDEDEEEDDEEDEVEEYNVETKEKEKNVKERNFRFMKKH